MTNHTRGAALGGGGHSMVESPVRPTPLTVFAKEELAEIRQELDVKFGKDRAHQIADYNRNLFIFPNLILISLWRTVRTFYPVSPDYMEVDAWALLPKGESQELRQKRYENFLSFLGPAGFATPDDVAALEGCQRGFATNRELQWSDISRGMGREVPSTIDELQMRAFWRRWQALMQGKRGPTDCSDRAERLQAAE
jgi:p-cumate 2,3-dioxygenase alpha subunit